MTLEPIAIEVRTTYLTEWAFFTFHVKIKEVAK
jgi:hypothetical protein